MRVDVSLVPGTPWIVEEVELSANVAVTWGNEGSNSLQDAEKVRVELSEVKPVVIPVIPYWLPLANSRL